MNEYTIEELQDIVVDLCVKLTRANRDIIKRDMMLDSKSHTIACKNEELRDLRCQIECLQEQLDE